MITNGQKKFFKVKEACVGCLFQTWDMLNLDTWEGLEASSKPDGCAQ
jgi:hypothetical protein